MGLFPYPLPHLISLRSSRRRLLPPISSISVSHTTIPESPFSFFAFIFYNRELFGSSFPWPYRSLASLRERTICSGITAELLSEGCRKPACTAEACHICDLGHGILSALHQRKAFSHTIFLEISGHSFSRQLMKQPTTDFSGKMNLICEFLQRHYGVKMGV